MSLFAERKLIIGGFSLAILLTGLSGFASYLNATQLMGSMVKVKHTHALLTQLTDVIATIPDTESELRSYFSYGNQTELSRYYMTIRSLDEKLRSLRLQVADNPLYYQQLVSLESLVNQWKLLIDQSIDIHQKYPLPKRISSNLRLQIQQTRMDIQRLVVAMQSSEEKQMQQGIEQAQSNTFFRLTIDLISTFLSFMILSSMLVLHHQQLVKRQQAELQRQQAETCQKILVQEKELSDLKLHFFAMVSHEFRTPLSLILGSAQLLLEDIQDWSLEKKQNNLERIQSSARIINQLLNDTLTLTRAEAGKLEFTPTLIDVESFCLNLVEDFRVLNESTHQIKFFSSGHCPSMCLDENLLFSMLSNLLSNAVKYSPQGGIIQFNLSYSAEELIFQVQDQGIGIPADALQHLYEPFGRASNVGMIAGTGLGLAVIKKCVDLHYGKIAVESKVRVGTTVTISLPTKF